MRRLPRFKNEPLLRDLGFYFGTATPALPPCCPLHQRRTDSKEDLCNDSSDFRFWQRWDDFLNLLFLDIWICGGHNLKSLVVQIRGAPSAGREDWDPNLDLAH